MSETDNESLSEATALRVGLIADADEAPRYAEAVRRCSGLELCASAGMPQDVAPGGVDWYDDTRVLIAQGGVDVMVTGSSPRVGAALGEMAAEHSLHVWQPPPLGRNFAEAIEAARRLKTTETAYRVASWWEHVGAQVRWALEFEPGCKPLFSEVQVSAPGPALQSWRSSQVDAGGGVLAFDAYAALEALTAIRGLPESVAGTIAKCRSSSTGAPRETEDVAIAILRYEDGGVACVRAAWDIPPPVQITLHHGSKLSVRYDDNSAAVLDRDGRLIEERLLPPGFLAAEMERLVAEITGQPDREAAAAAIERHLAVSALLEAIYLSARTEHPEIPRRLFEVQKWPQPER